jgi:hypothetical protein
MKIDGDRVKGKAQGLFVDTDLMQFKFYRMPLSSDVVLFKGYQSVPCAWTAGPSRMMQSPTRRGDIRSTCL